jgi:hypothetical protein
MGGAGQRGQAIAGRHCELVALALLDQRQRAVGDVEAGGRGQLRRHQGLGQRQGHLPVAQAAQQRVGGCPALAVAAAGLAGQQQVEAAVGHLRPQRGIPLAGLGTQAPVLVDLGGEQLGGAVLDQCVAVSAKQPPLEPLSPP